ncbi:hypothetical protein FDP41_009044 [Naegleria fowleri]|uniref:Clp1 P-loop domain-containing protein n=1 Tax=Naegleria fowleri TaxID=5763 RepID=A0A6A5BFI7_NAEFO|nr:uncharacterized protein FDP41_009044 [Naegleria fowleri]KAF0972795.1 hypothetical protein FDP41_009044 [Naegleria fowleri]CAG4719570.1 unnamed protein product [Naegleria fowleri]
MLNKVIEPSCSPPPHDHHKLDSKLSDHECEEMMADDDDMQENDQPYNRNDTKSSSSTRHSFTTRLKNEHTTIHVIGVCYFRVLQGTIRIMGKVIKLNPQTSYLLNASCQFGMIPIENCGKDQALIEFYIPNSEDEPLKFDQFVRCFYIHRNMQIFNHQKLDKSKRKLKSLYIFPASDESVPSHALKFTFADNFIKRVMNRVSKSSTIHNSSHSSSSSTTSSKKTHHSKYLIVGHGLSGKSVFSSYLMNVLLNHYPKVAFLDLNINVPSHGVRGTISLSIHKSATFGPLHNSQNFEENELIDWCYHGHASTDIQMETFIHQSMKLYEIYYKKFKDLPLVVNTQSLLPSTGYQIVLELARLFSPIDVIILSNFKNPSYSPSPSGPIHHDALNNYLTFIHYDDNKSNNLKNIKNMNSKNSNGDDHNKSNNSSDNNNSNCSEHYLNVENNSEQQFNGENTPIFDLRNLETLFILDSKQSYRNHYFSKINMQHFWYFSRYYSTEEFLCRFNPFLNTTTTLENNNNNYSLTTTRNSSSNSATTTTTGTTTTIMNHSQSIYQFFSELTPCRKIKWSSLIITLLNMDPSELSQGLYHLNASFVGMYKFSHHSNGFYSTLSQHYTKSEYPLMTLKTNAELETQFIGIGFVKKICPYEKVIYLCAPLRDDEEVIHHLTVGTCVFDFNPEEEEAMTSHLRSVRMKHAQTFEGSSSSSSWMDSSSSSSSSSLSPLMTSHHQPYFQYKSMTIDKGEILLNAHRVKLEQQMQQHYTTKKK